MEGDCQANVRSTAGRIGRRVSQSHPPPWQDVGFRNDRPFDPVKKPASEGAAPPREAVNTLPSPTTDPERASRLEERSHAIDGVAVGVAHELNNLLHIVRGYVSFALNALPEGSGPRSDLAKALSATDDAAELAGGLLGVARVDERLAIVDVANAIGAVSRLLEPILGDDIRVSRPMAKEPLYAVACEGALQRALLNLCLNARDAMPDGGGLTLSATTRVFAEATRLTSGIAIPGAYAAVSVSDTGIGIPLDSQPKVLEPFFTTKPNGSGTGLGLALAREFVERSNGAIEIESNPGAGCRIVMYLPLADQDAARQGVDPADIASRVSSEEKCLA